MNTYARGACLVVATLLSSQAFADLPPLVASAQTVVVGVNNAVIDLPAIQAAVNAGGSVLLQGTFDLGEGGKVLVQNDIDIGGETDASGALLTIIRRGEWCFHTPYPTTMPPLAAGPVVAIHNLHFVESRGTAIHLGYSGGAFLHNNIIDQMRMRQTSPIGSPVVSERA